MIAEFIQKLADHVRPTHIQAEERLFLHPDFKEKTYPPRQRRHRFNDTPSLINWAKINADGNKSVFIDVQFTGHGDDPARCQLAVMTNEDSTPRNAEWGTVKLRKNPIFDEIFGYKTQRDFADMLLRHGHLFTETKKILLGKKAENAQMGFSPGEPFDLSLMLRKVTICDASSTSKVLNEYSDENNLSIKYTVDDEPNRTEFPRLWVLDCPYYEGMEPIPIPVYLSYSTDGATNVTFKLEFFKELDLVRNIGTEIREHVEEILDDDKDDWNIYMGWPDGSLNPKVKVDQSEPAF